MLIPLNVLLYQLSANSIYESQNIDLTGNFDNVQLFDQEQLNAEFGDELYLVSDQVLLNALSRTPEDQFPSRCVFLCICQDENFIPVISIQICPWCYSTQMNLFRWCSTVS